MIQHSLATAFGNLQSFGMPDSPTGNGIVERSCRSIKTIAARKQCSTLDAVYWYNVIPRDGFSRSTAPANYSVSMWSLKAFEGQGLRARLCCRKISDSIFWLHCFTHVDWPAQCLAQRKSQKKYTKRKDRKKDKRRKYFFHTFLYLLGEGTDRRYVL